MSILVKIGRKVASFVRKKIKSRPKWEKLEYFDESWKNRMKVMVKFIPDNVSVIDLGCGPMWLKQFLKIRKYYPVDYKKRAEDTIVCDFNKHEFPGLKADFAFVGGCLEYIKDYQWFVKQIAANVNSCVISYCAVELVPDLATRHKYAWVNNLSRNNIIDLFEKNGMSLKGEDKYLNTNLIFMFSKNN